MGLAADHFDFSRRRVADGANRLCTGADLGKALKFMVKNEDNGEGEVTSFGALCTALSATTAPAIS